MLNSTNIFLKPMPSLPFRRSKREENFALIFFVFFCHFNVVMKEIFSLRFDSTRPVVDVWKDDAIGRGKIDDRTKTFVFSLRRFDFDLKRTNSSFRSFSTKTFWSLDGLNSQKIETFFFFFLQIRK